LTVGLVDGAAGGGELQGQSRWHAADTLTCCTRQAYFMLDEMLLAGELQEPSKKAITRVIEAQDQLVENAKQGVGLPEGTAAPGGIRV
jgi:hypothetical protein